MRSAKAAGWTKGPKWSNSGRLRNVAFGQPIGDAFSDRRRALTVEHAGHDDHTSGDLRKHVPGAVQAAGLERAGLVFRVALQAHTLR